MKTDDFNYNLPEELIAQHPEEKRDNSRLLVVDRGKDKTYHKHFYDVLDYLNEGDTIVLNDSKVLHARLFGKKEETGAKIEVFVLKLLSDNHFEVLIRPSKRVKIGTKVIIDENLSLVVEEKYEEGLTKVNFICESGDVFDYIEKVGQVPLPPYIKEKLTDQKRYQTVYAKDLGSTAAPTAGLHFTKKLLEKIKEKNVNIAYITLHVGLGTFKPVSSEDISDHKMHTESFIVGKEAVKKINMAKEKGGKVVAVGTTCVRTLESVYKKYGKVVPCAMDTDIFIYPGFEFNVVDRLITNFHLPKSTLLMLTSAFYEREKILKVYEEAINERYRFFSFGDAMLLL